MPIERSDGRRATSTRNETAPTRLSASTNSYMLPHGTRPTDTPRVTRTLAWTSTASPVMPRPIRPNQAARPGSNTSAPGRGAAGGAGEIGEAGGAGGTDADETL